MLTLYVILTIYLVISFFVALLLTREFYVTEIKGESYPLLYRIYCISASFLLFFICWFLIVIEYANRLIKRFRKKRFHDAG